MKKIIFLIFTVLFFQMSFANIFVPTGAQINELLWDVNGDWQLEISYFSEADEYLTYDSIVISTTNFSYKLHLPVTNEHEIDYIIFNKSIVGDSLDFKSEGDSIYIKTYTEGSILYNENCLIYGDYENSMVIKPDQGKSIVLFEGLNRFYTISDKPTLGFVNSPIGALGRIQGKVFSTNEAVLHGYYSFGLTFEFQPSINGDYSTYLVPGNHKITQIYHQLNEIYSEWIDIHPLDFNINIDDTLDLDIHITDPDFVNVHEKMVKQDFEVYPNPVSNKIFIKPAEFHEYKTVNIQVLNVKGQKVAIYTKRADELISIDLQNNIKAGIYMLNILNQDQVIYSQKVIVNPF